MRSAMPTRSIKSKCRPMTYDYRQIIRVLAARNQHPVEIVGDGAGVDALMSEPGFGERVDLDSLNGVGTNLIVVANVLERMSEDELEDAVAILARGNRPVLFIISTIFSPYVDASGRNVVRTIKDAGWWKRRLNSTFPDLHEIPAIEHHSCLFLTRPPGPVGRLRLKACHRLDRWQKSIERRQRAKRIAASGAPAHGIAEQDLFAILAGRSVAIVGNAHRLSDTAFGAEIDNHDIIVRLNRAPIIAAASHGIRTDWIATSVDIPQELLAVRGADHVLWMSPGYKRLPEWLRQWPKVYFVTQRDRDEMTTRLGARPSTGFSAIDLVRRSPAARIDLYGFDFFDSLSLSGHRRGETSPHDFAAERQAVLDVIDRDPRFTLR